jgi:hypothetical protein
MMMAVRMVMIRNKEFRQQRHNLSVNIHFARLHESLRRASFFQEGSPLARAKVG